MRKNRLLLIENDVIVGAGIGLGLHDFAVDWVRDGLAAQRALQSESYSVVVLDLGLPRQQCLAILEALYMRTNPVPLVVIDAQESGDDLAEVLRRIRAAVCRQAQRGGREEAMFTLPFSWR